MPRTVLIWPALFFCVSCNRSSPTVGVASIDAIMQSVVEVIGDQGHGTGFLAIDKTTIVTNFHVVAGQPVLKVRFANGHEMEVDGYRVASPKFDLALLHLPAEAPVGRPLPLADQPPAVGSAVQSAGSPRGLHGSVSTGVVSAIRSWPEITKALSITDPTKRGKHSQTSRWIQTTAPLSEGNSGGPLLNAAGEAVGVNTWQLSAEAGQNLNFAADICHLRELVSTFPMLRIRPLGTIPRSTGDAMANETRPEIQRQYNRMAWVRISQTLGRWYAYNAMVNLGLWDEAADEEARAQQDRLVVNQLRASARRTTIDVEELSRLRSSLLVPVLSNYLEGLVQQLTKVAAAYNDAAKTYAIIRGTNDEEVLKWMLTIMDPQGNLSDFINLDGAASASRLAYIFDEQFPPTIIFQPEECLHLCDREAIVPPLVFSTIFTGTPRGYLLPTYEQDPDHRDAGLILEYILKTWPKESAPHRAAAELLKKRKKG